MNKTWTIFKREYLTRVMTKGFIIGTAATPILLLLLTLGPQFLINMKSEHASKIAVVAYDDEIYQDLVNSFSDTLQSGETMFQFNRIDVDTSRLDSIRAVLSSDVNRNTIDGYLLIPPDVYDQKEFEYYAKNIDFDLKYRFQNTVSKIIIDKRIQRSNLDADVIHTLTQRTNLKTFKITSSGKEEEEVGLSYALTFVMMMFLYMALIMYGMFVMRSVYEEKTSRVAEILVSSCKPFQLMAGKVFGVGAVGLTQYLIWTIAAGLLTVFSTNLVQAFTNGNAGFSIPTIPISVLVYFIIYFVLGYLLYATLYATLGAMVTNDQDAQQFQFPITLLIIIGFFLSFYIIRNPNSQISVIISMIPFFAPLAMFTRISTLMPPFHEIMLSIALLLLTIILLIWIGGKIFRVGILMYGKRPTVPEILKWMRYK
ncbi:ABC transporter permease [candidate division KSB1 bacterium]|nr:ABC transporter permease [candidate division KSB1 bacterium]